MAGGREFLTLNQFMRRGQVLAQYRTFLRTARRLPGDQGRDDVVEMVRAEFRAKSGVPAKEEDQVPLCFNRFSKLCFR